VPILRTTGGCCGSVTEQLKAHLGRLGASTVREQSVRRTTVRDEETENGKRNFVCVYNR